MFGNDKELLKRVETLERELKDLAGQMKELSGLFVDYAKVQDVQAKNIKKIAEYLNGGE